MMDGAGEGYCTLSAYIQENNIVLKFPKAIPEKYNFE